MWAFDSPNGYVKWTARITGKQTSMATATKTKKHRSSQSTPDHYTIRVELLGIRPTIWRRIHLDGRTRLDALHHILQAAMGWSDSHLHKFEIRDKHYGVPDPEFTDPGWEVLDEKKYRLNQLLAEGDSCTYLYDFGDGWQHRITVERSRTSNQRRATAVLPGSRLASVPARPTMREVRWLSGLSRPPGGRSLRGRNKSLPGVGWP
jgi:hypothetical protein